MERFGFGGAALYSVVAMIADILGATRTLSEPQDGKVT